LHQIAIQSMMNTGHIIVCGYGRSGSNLVGFLEQEDLSFIALDLDPRHVRDGLAAHKNVVYGNAAKREVLMAAGLMRAKTLVITYKDQHSSLAILRHVQELRPDLPVVVRTNDNTHVEALKQAGAAEVVAEIIEGSVMLASQALLMAGVPLHRVIHQIQSSRARRYAVFSGFFNVASQVNEVLDHTQPRFASILLKSGYAAVGRKLGELNLSELNIEVNGIRRPQQLDAHPTAELHLRVGDVLVLLGTPDALKQAENLLQDGKIEN
jgi:CPA2 family monovalent cation:H+ antiporter-2